MHRQPLINRGNYTVIRFDKVSCNILSLARVIQTDFARNRLSSSMNAKRGTCAWHLWGHDIHRRHSHVNAPIMLV